MSTSMPVCSVNWGTTSCTKRVSGTLSMRMLIVSAWAEPAASAIAGPSISSFFMFLPPYVARRSFEGAEREPLDQIFAKERQQEKDRNHGEQGRGGKQRDLDAAVRLQRRKADRQGVGLPAREDQGKQELVPAQDEAQQPGRQDARC